MSPVFIVIGLIEVISKLEGGRSEFRRRYRNVQYEVISGSLFLENNI